MRRIAHGATTVADTIETVEDFANNLNALTSKFEIHTQAEPPQNTPFVYLFNELSDDDDALILDSLDTLNNLSELGERMRDQENEGAYNSPIPSIYTYFGQFIDHDVTFTDIKKTEKTDSELLDSKTLKPWAKADIFEKVRNKRSSLLDLDCVYGVMKNGLLPPRDKNNPEKMAVGRVSKSGYAIQHKDEWNDVPRGPFNANPREDRPALIGDFRNDSHVIVSQMHLGFLRAYNAIVDQEKCSFDDARRLLQMHYHWIVINEFLPTIVSQEAIDGARKDLVYDAGKGLPLEFAVGAYRFGHSMVRTQYYLNDYYQRLSLASLFTLTLLTKTIGDDTLHGKGYETLPDCAVIQWRKFLPGGKNATRSMRPQMVEPLFEILDEANLRVPGEFRLSVLDLKRSYMMRIPTGQAIAKRLKLPELSADEIESTFRDATDREFLRKTTLSTRTPLFLYVLAEAALNNEGKLGPVGGRLVARVLISLVQSHKYSFLNEKWSPHLGKIDGQFYLTDLLQLAGVLEPDS